MGQPLLVEYYILLILSRSQVTGSFSSHSFQSIIIELGEPSRPSSPTPLLGAGQSSLEHVQRVPVEPLLEGAELLTSSLINQFHLTVNTFSLIFC